MARFLVRAGGMGTLGEVSMEPQTGKMSYKALKVDAKEFKFYFNDFDSLLVWKRHGESYVFRI